MYYSNIKYYDVANGAGVRTSLFVSGCRKHCKNCFNKETWNFFNGTEFTDEVLKNILDSLAPDYIAGFSLLGGEPFEPENQKELVKVLKIIKDKYPNKEIWCWTGLCLDNELKMGGSKYTYYTSEMLGYIDVLVDGPFIEELKDLTLAFRGSSNQRIINMKETRKQNKIVILNL